MTLKNSLLVSAALIFNLVVAGSAFSQVMDPLTVAQVVSANNIGTANTHFTNNTNRSLFPLWAGRAVSAGITTRCSRKASFTTQVDKTGVLRFSSTDAGGVGAVTWTVAKPPSGVVGPLVVRIARVTAPEGSPFKPTIIVEFVGKYGFAREQLKLPPQTKGPIEFKIIPSRMGRRGVVALQSLKTIELSLETNGGCGTTVEIDRITFGGSSNPSENVNLISLVGSTDKHLEDSTRARYSEKALSEHRRSSEPDSPSPHLGISIYVTRTATPEAQVEDPCEGMEQSDEFKKFDQECRSTPQPCKTNCHAVLTVKLDGNGPNCRPQCQCDSAPKGTSCDPGEGSDCRSQPHACDDSGYCRLQGTQDWSPQCTYGDPVAAQCKGQSDLGGFEPAGTPCKVPPNAPGACDGSGHCVVAPAPGTCQGVADCTPCDSGKFCFKNECRTEDEAAKIVCENSRETTGGKGLCQQCKVFFGDTANCVTGVISPDPRGVDMRGSPCERTVNGTRCSGTCLANGGCSVSCPAPTPTPTPQPPSTRLPNPSPSPSR